MKQEQSQSTNVNKTKPKSEPTEHAVKFNKEIKIEAYNEFEENPKLLYSAFAHIFLLGKGIQQSGTLPKSAVRHLLLQYDGRAASCLRLLFLLFNQKQRHATAQAVAAAVKMHPEAFKHFAQWVSDKEFVQQLIDAQKDPSSPTSRKLIAKVMKQLAIVNKKVPYSTAERKGAMSHLYALVNHFGMPSVYFTFSIDDTYNTLNIRLSYPQENNTSFPATESGLGESLKKGETEFNGIKISNAALRTTLASGGGAVAAAEIFSQLVDAIFTDLLGMPPTAEAKRSVPLPGRFHGVFGTCTAAFGVTETQERGSLHMHLVSFVQDILQTEKEKLNILIRSLGNVGCTTNTTAAGFRGTSFYGTDN